MRTSEPPRRFVAFVTKGLRPVCERELRERIEDVTVLRTSPKYVVFEAPLAALDRLTELHTVDDVRVLLRFEEYASKPDADDVVRDFPFEEIPMAKRTIARIRTLGETFSLTLSRHKNDALDLAALEARLKAILEDRTDARYTPESSDDFDLRVHCDGTTLLVGVRLTEYPLYYRAYKAHGREGALRPSVAAALVYLTDPSPGTKLVDTFCGTGTILCEGVRQGLEPYGGDVDEEAVRYASAHLRDVGARPRRVSVLDARDSKLPGDYYDLAVSNLPWGDHHDLNAVGLYSAAIPEFARILDEDGRIVLLGPKPDLARKHLAEAFPDHETGQFRLGFLGQRPYVSYAYPPDVSLNTA